jgi:hypothetical protein
LELGDKLLFKNEDFAAGELTQESEHLDRVLASLREGVLNASGLEVELRAPRGSRLEDPLKPEEVDAYNWRLLKFPRDTTWFAAWTPEPATFSFVVDGSGGSNFPLVNDARVERIDRALITGDPPYMNLQDLGRAFIRTTQDLGPGMGNSFWVAAPLYTRITEIRLDSPGTLGLRIETPRPVAESDLRLAVRRWSPKEDLREVYAVKLGKDDNSPLRGGEAQIPLETAQFIEAHLLFRNVDVGQATHWVPSSDSANPRMAAFRSTLLGDERLDMALGVGEKELRNSGAFEITVGWVLTFCGYQVLATDLKAYDLGNAPDIIGFVPYAKSAVAVSVTLNEFSSDDLVRLRDQSERLTRALPGLEVLPVAVSRKQAVTEPEAETARHLGIALVGRDELTHLLQMADANEPPPKCHDYLVKRTSLRPGSDR